MSKILFPAFLFLSLILQSQNPNFNTASAVTTKGDLEATFYSRDTLAHALYIYEEGDSKFDPSQDFDLVTKYTAKIKIFDKEGFEEANIEIPLGKNDRNSEKLKDLKAATYNLENGRIVKTTLYPGEVYTEEFETHDLKKFTFPNIKPGSVLVYSYELISPFIYDFTSWKFQDYIPKAYSKFTAKIPGNYEYNTILKGSLKLKTDTARIVRNCIDFGHTSNPADCVETVFDMEHIPAFTSEKYLTTPRNYLSVIEYELKQITRLDGTVRRYTREWDDVDREIRTDKSIGKQLKKDHLVRDLLPDSIRGLPVGLEKAEKIYRFVQKEFTWNDEYRIFADMDIKDVVENRTGTVLEINTILHNLLVSENFEVLPVMSATRNSGFPTKIHPVLSDFNYFFVQLSFEGKEYLLDATAKTLDFGRLPYRALNGYARLMDFETGSSWIDIRPTDYSRIIYQDSLQVKADGSAEGISRQMLDGYHAYEYRNAIKSSSEDQIFNQLSNAQETTRALNTVVSNKSDPSEKLEIRYDLSNASQKIGDKIYLNPFSFRFFGENPLKTEERTYPVDFGYKDFYMYSSLIKIPEGYKVTSLPEPKKIGLLGNGGSLIFSAKQINESEVLVNYQLKFAFPSYPAEYYPYLKEFFGEIIEVQNQSLIIIEENS